MRLIILCSLFLALGACSMAPKGVWHTVEEGQTLYRISREYDIDEVYLARINGINDPKRLQPGERVFIPGRSQAKDVPPTALKKSTAGGTAPGSDKHVGSNGARRPEAAKDVRTPEVRPSSSGFVWPLKGELVREYSANGKTPSKGIEIAVPTDSPVVAAAAGRVIYSGDGIKGFGNLIILKHADSFYSVYGFNRKNLVKVGSMVAQGEKIALSGAPPGGGAARLHFEIRRGKKAVNPIPYLP